MDVFEQAKYRMRNRQWEQDKKDRRMAEFRSALEVLEREEFLAAHPDEPNKVGKMAEIRSLRAEIGEMMNEEFGMDEQYKQMADS